MIYAKLFWRLMRASTPRKRVSFFLGALGALLMDLGDMVHPPQQRCFAYGGLLSSGKVRLCPKSRWHTDSHFYEPFDPFKFESLEEFAESHPING